MSGSMWVFLAIRDGVVEIAQVSEFYDDAAYAASLLIRNITGKEWLDTYLPNFAAGEWWQKDGLRVGVVQAPECKVFI